MSEQEAEQSTVEKKPPRSIKEEFKRISVIVTLLVMFVIIFGQIVPRLFFGMKKDGIAEKIYTPVAKQAENSIERTEEIVKAPVDISSESVAILEPPSKNGEAPHSLEEKIISLETANKTAISELKSKFEAQVSAAQTKADNMLLGLVVFDQLKEAVKNGESYSEQLSKLKKIIEDNLQGKEIIVKLLPYSDTGITTPTTLAKEFNQLAKLALISKDSGWFKNVLHKFITIRRIGERVGDDDESVLARAEIRLLQGDLTATLKELSQLSPPAKEIFDKWIAQGNDWLEAQENLNELQLLLIKTKSFKTEFMFQP